MDSFRLTLLVIGLLIVALVYLLGRQRRKSDNDEISELEKAFEQEFENVGIRAERQTVSADQLSGLSGIKPSADPVEVEEKAGTSETETTAAKLEPALLVLTVMAKASDKPFSGAQLSNAFSLLGFEFGQMDIYHCPDVEQGQAIFSIANIIEPGHFQQLAEEDFTTPGMALILALPSVVDGAGAFELMLNKARQLEEMLGGQLCNQERIPINESGLQALRDKAAPYVISE